MSTVPPTLQDMVAEIEQLKFKSLEVGGVCSLLRETLESGGMGIKKWPS